VFVDCCVGRVFVDCCVDRVFVDGCMERRGVGQTVSEYVQQAST